MLTVPRLLEDRIREELADDEVLEAAFDGIRSRWLPWSFPGELLAQPHAVALTNRRVLILEVPRLSQGDARVIQDARRPTVQARLRRVRRWQWTPLQGSWARLELLLPSGKFALYVDRTSRDAASAFTTAINGNWRG